MAIVNNKHKFIYMHPQKCAGGALSNLLKREFSDTNLHIEKNHHPNFSDVVELTNQPLEKYFKFGVTRNTYDRVVSMYFHAKKHNNYTHTFDHFVLRSLSSWFGMHDKFTYQNEYMMNYIIRFEHFAEDVKNVMKKLGVYDFELEYITHNTQRPTTDYRSYYNEHTKNCVYNTFKWEINKFNYEF